MANLQIAQDLSATAQFVVDRSGNASHLSLSTEAVGVGTTDPKSTLHIVDDAPADANDGQLRISAPNGYTVLVGRAADYSFIQSHNRQPLALNPIGNNVGIGTTTPISRLHIVARPRHGQFSSGLVTIF